MSLRGAFLHLWGGGGRMEVLTSKWKRDSDLGLQEQPVKASSQFWRKSAIRSPPLTSVRTPKAQPGEQVKCRLL